MSQLLHIEPWECAALQLLAKGMSTSELAAALHLPEFEIDARLAALFTRMGVKTEREAAAECVKRGLLFAAGLGRGSSTAPRIADPARELSAIGGSAHHDDAAPSQRPQLFEQRKEELCMTLFRSPWQPS